MTGGAGRRRFAGGWVSACDGVLEAWCQGWYAASGRQRRAEVVVAVEPGCRGVMLAFEVVFHRRVARGFQDGLIAVADLAIGAVDDQGGQRRVPPFMSAVHHQEQNLAYPAAHGHRGLHARCLLDLLGELAVRDYDMIGARHVGQDPVGLLCPGPVSLSRRDGRSVTFMPVSVPFHGPILADPQLPRGLSAKTAAQADSSQRMKYPGIVVSFTMNDFRGGQFSLPVTVGGCPQRFVGEQKGTVGLLKSVITIVGTPGPTNRSAESAVDKVLRLAGEVGEVPQSETTVGGSEVADDVNLELVTVQLVEQFLSGQARQARSVLRRLQLMSPTVAKRVIVRDVTGKLRVPAAGDYHPHAVGRMFGQERSNAGKPAVGPGTLILIESVYDQYKTFVAFSGPLAGQVEQPAAFPIPSTGAAGARNGLGSVDSELFDHGLGECEAISLASKAARYEERRDIDACRRMDGKPGGKRSLTGPRDALPQRVRFVADAEPGELCKLKVPVPQDLRREIPGLCPIAGAAERTAHRRPGMLAARKPSRAHPARWASWDVGQAPPVLCG